MHNKFKERFFKKNGIQIIKMPFKDLEPNNLFHKIKKLGLNRIFVEAGASFMSQLVKFNIIENLYLFKSSKKLLFNGRNNCNIIYIKKLKLSKKIKVRVNLNGDSLYKVKL